MANSEGGKAQQRIIGAAVELFAKVGYHGASTRDVARMAEVSEVTIYRHYSCKRDLFVAAVEFKLRSLHLRDDLLAEIANALSVTSALKFLMLLLTDIVITHPELIRLLRFSALELEGGLELAHRKYLSDLLDTTAACFSRWTDSEMAGADTRMLVLGLAASVAGVDAFYPLLWGERASFDAPEGGTSTCASAWLAILQQGSNVVS